MDATNMKRMFFPLVRGETVGDIYYATITTNDLDRQGEIVDPDGIDFTNFMVNGVVLYGHEYGGIGSIPVGKIASLALIHENDRKKLDAGWRFQGEDVTPLITAVKKSWERGFLNTVSIGFIPLERSEDGKTITKAELLEFSIVPIPANPQALRLNGFTDAEVKALEMEPTPEELIADLETQIDPSDEISEKEGRVLSTKNYGLVKNCVDSLQALMDASDGKSASGDATPEPVSDETEKALTYLYMTL